MITRVDGHHYAVLVEDLEDVSPFMLQPLSRALALDAGWATAAIGLVDREGTPVLALDVARMLGATSMAA